MLLRVALMLTVAVCDVTASLDFRRPIYSIGHMVNSIGEIRTFLDMGANVLELDITFHGDGQINKVFHGEPCDCDRVCDRAAELTNYLDYVRQLTDPITGKPQYVNKLLLLFFDLKLENVKDKHNAGMRMADEVLDHLWAIRQNRIREFYIKVIMYIQSTSHNATFVGFIDRFRDRGVSQLLDSHVGFDGGMEDIHAVKDMLESVGVLDKVWIGDGTSNCDSAKYSDSRLYQEVRSRESSKYDFIDKVYHWTIDNEMRIRRSFDLTVDGIITNRPDLVKSILQEEPFVDDMRLATVYDNPFVKYDDNYKADIHYAPTRDYCNAA